MSLLTAKAAAAAKSDPFHPLFTFLQHLNPSPTASLFARNIWEKRFSHLIGVAERRKGDFP